MSSSTQKQRLPRVVWGGSDKKDYEVFPGIDFHELPHPHPFSVLKSNAESFPDRTAMMWLNDAGVETRRLSYAQLLEAIRAVAYDLVTTHRLERGDRALLCYPPSLEFYIAFWACLSTGVIAVPVCPVDPFTPKGDVAQRLSTVLFDSSPRLILTNDEYLTALESADFSIATGYGTPDMKLDRGMWASTDRAAPITRDVFDFGEEKKVSMNEVAFLQYTSGSTGSPKGVMISHANLISNSVLICHLFTNVDGGSHKMQSFLELTGVCWLPHFHDLALIGHHIAPMLIGAKVAYLSPLSFIRDPLVWLRCMKQYTRVISGAPPFALDLCVNRVTAQEMKELRLQNLQALMLGAEPIRHEAMRNFAAKFKDVGFDERVFLPCYGLAENVVYGTGKCDILQPVTRIFIDQNHLHLHRELKETQDAEAGRWLVSSGQQVPDDLLSQPGVVLIVDPATQREVPEGKIGEIWITGKSKTLGYWNKSIETQAAFHNRLQQANPATLALFDSVKQNGKEVNGVYAMDFLRTGDLGAFHNGHLYVTGRIKDLIIINGLNIYPHDIETAVKDVHPSVRPGSVTAFAVEDQQGKRGEALAVLLEIRDPDEMKGPRKRSASRAQAIGLQFANAVARAPLPKPVTKFIIRTMGRLMAGCQRPARRAPSSSSSSASASTGHPPELLEEVAQSVRQVVFAMFGVPVADLAILQSRSIQMTSSGKNCRQANKSLLMSGSFDSRTLKRWQSPALKSSPPSSSSVSASAAHSLESKHPPASSSSSSSHVSSWIDVEGKIPIPSQAARSLSVSVGDKEETKRPQAVTAASVPNRPVPPLEEVKQSVLTIASRELRLDESILESLDPLRGLDEYGLDSIAATRVIKALEAHFSVRLSFFMFVGDPSVEGVARKIIDVIKTQPALVTEPLPDAVPDARDAQPICHANPSLSAPLTHHQPQPQPLSAPSQPTKPANATVAPEYHDTDSSVYILGIGTTVPPRSGSQEEAVDEMVQRMDFSPKKADLFKRIATNSGITTRHMVFDSAEQAFFGRRGNHNDEGIEARNAVFKDKAPKLSVESSLKAIADWGGDKLDVTHVLGITCTGVIVPGLEFQVMSALGLHESTERLGIVFMGCFGGLSGLKAARSIAAESPRNRVLVVCTELCSLHLQLDDRTENLVASALFSDGSAAMILGSGVRPGECPFFEVQHSVSHIIPDTLPLMSWELSSTGMLVGLDKSISSEIYNHIGKFSERLLRDVAVQDCTWALHPGGPMILHAIAQALNIPAEETEAAWHVLRDYGNMSSATILFVFDELRRRQKLGTLRPGRHIPSLAFGPGLNIEGVMLKSVWDGSERRGGAYVPSNRDAVHSNSNSSRLIT